MKATTLAPNGRLPAALLTAAALVCAALAWSWGGAGDGTQMPFWLGAAGIALGTLSAAWMLVIIGSQQRQLQRQALESARAREDERAMEQAQQYANRTRELLVAALDALPIGISIYDRQDHQVIRNRCLGDMFPGLFKDGGTGEPFESVLRRMLDMGLLAEPIDDKDAWIALRMAQRGKQHDGQPRLQQYVGDRWIHTYEVQTGQGYTVVASVEVTDLIRKENLLAQANDQLARKSSTDGLTGIANRRKFDDTLHSEWQRAARSGSSLSLLIVDIDHFKRFNDHYGHVAGDDCLRQVALVLASCVRRAGEMLARYGGEEFVMLLPGASMAHAQDVAQRCLERIAQRAIPHAASAAAPVVTFSIGVAHVQPTFDVQPESLVIAADTAMYRAKSAGRARLAVASLADWNIDKDAPRSHWASIA